LKGKGRSSSSRSPVVTNNKPGTLIRVPTNSKPTQLGQEPTASMTIETNSTASPTVSVRSIAQQPVMVATSASTARRPSGSHVPIVPNNTGMKSNSYSKPIPITAKVLTKSVQVIHEAMSSSLAISSNNDASTSSTLVSVRPIAQQSVMIASAARRGGAHHAPVILNNGPIKCAPFNQPTQISAKVFPKPVQMIQEPTSSISIATNNNKQTPNTLVSVRSIAQQSVMVTSAAATTTNTANVPTTSYVYLVNRPFYIIKDGRK